MKTQQSHILHNLSVDDYEYSKTIIESIIIDEESDLEKIRLYKIYHKLLNLFKTNNFDVGHLIFAIYELDFILSVELYKSRLEMVKLAKSLSKYINVPLFVDKYIGRLNLMENGNAT